VFRLSWLRDPTRGGGGVSSSHLPPFFFSGSEASFFFHPILAKFMRFCYSRRMNAIDISQLRVEDSPNMLRFVPSAKSAVAPGLVFLVTCYLAMKLSEFSDFFLLHIELGPILLIVPWLMAGPLALLVRLLYRLYDPVYEISEEEVKTIRGNLGLGSQVMEASFEQINGVEIRSNIISRLLNVGTLVIGTGMTGENEVLMWGIEDPERYQNFIISKIEQEREEHPEWYREQFLYD